MTSIAACRFDGGLDAGHDAPVDEDGLPGPVEVVREGEARWTAGCKRDLDENGTANQWLTEAGAVCAADCKLSAHRYRPLRRATVEHRDPPEVVEELRGIATQVLGEIDQRSETVQGALACPHRLVQWECSCMGGFSARLADQPDMIVSGAGGRDPKLRCGRTAWSGRRQDSMSARASFRVGKISPFRSSSCSRAWNLSMNPFSRGDPGWRKAVRAPTAEIHRRTASASNSGPGSDRTGPGTPRRRNRSVRNPALSVGPAVQNPARGRAVRPQDPAGPPFRHPGAAHGQDRCRGDDVRDSEGSPDGLPENLGVQRPVGDRPAQPFVLLLQTLQAGAMDRRSSRPTPSATGRMGSRGSRPAGSRPPSTGRGRATPPPAEAGGPSVPAGSALLPWLALLS